MKCEKNVHRAGKCRNFSFINFSKIFKNEGNHHIFTLEQLKYQNSLIWMKKVPKCEMQENVPRAGLGENINFFSIFQKVLKNEGNHHIFTLEQLKYQNSLIWIRKGAKVWNAKKKSTAEAWAKTWRKPSYFHLWQPKYQNSLIWMKKVPKCEMRKKNVHWAGVGKIFSFFQSSKSFQKWRKPSYFHFRISKYKNSLIWMKKVPKCEIQEKCP